MKGIVIGGIMRDIFIHHKQAETAHVHAQENEQAYIIFAEGKKIEIDAISYSVGGGAANTATSFSRLGIPASIIGTIGDDEEGCTILQKLEREGIDTCSISKTKKLPTGTSFIIPCPSGNRTVLVYRGANEFLSAKDLDENAVRNVDFIYVTSLVGKAAAMLPHLATLAQQHKKPIAINPGKSQLAHHASFNHFCHALPAISILILNQDEALLLMNCLTKSSWQGKNINTHQEKPLPPLLAEPLMPTACFSLVQFFQTIHAKGPATIAVTNGKDGVYVSDGKTIYYHASIPTKVVNTVGAGDAFGSTFTAYLMKKEPITKALLAGITNSASVIGSFDTHTGLLTAQELENKLSQTSLTPVQEFPLF